MEVLWAYFVGVIGSFITAILGGSTAYTSMQEAKEHNSSLTTLGSHIVDNILSQDAGLIVSSLSSNIGLTGGIRTGISIRDIVQQTGVVACTTKAVLAPPDLSTTIKSVLDQCGMYIVQNEERVLKNVTEKVIGTTNYSDKITSGAIKDESQFYVSNNTAQAIANAFSDLGYFDEAGTHVEPGIGIGSQFNPTLNPPTTSNYNNLYLTSYNKVKGTSLGGEWENRGISYSRLWSEATYGINLSNYDYVKFGLDLSSSTNRASLTVYACNFEEDTTYTVIAGRSDDCYRITPSIDNYTIGAAVATWDHLTHEITYERNTVTAYDTDLDMGTFFNDAGSLVISKGSTLYTIVELEKDVDWKDPGVRIPTRENHVLVDIFPLEHLSLPGVISDTFPAVDYITMPLDIPGKMEEILENIRSLSIAQSIAADEPYQPDDPITPVVPPVGPDTPTGSANKLFTVHTINDANMNTLGGYLWSSNFVSVIEHLFTTPIQAVLGMHELHYAGTIPISNASDPIKLGYLSSGATGGLVSNRYMSFSCGSISVPEAYGNVIDYQGYTSASLYLPYIGYENIDINQIMGRKLKIDYHIDVYTGACVARVYTVYVNGGENEIYNFYGQCGSQLPVTSGDYSSLVGGAIKGAIGGAVAGGALGAITGALGGAASGHVAYSRTNGFNSNVSPMGRQIPILVLERPISYAATNYNKFYGHPTNINKKLGDVSGYTRVKDIHLDKVACTEAEKNELENMLKTGVIL